MNKGDLYPEAFDSKYQQPNYVCYITNYPFGIITHYFYWTSMINSFKKHLELFTYL